MPLTSADLTQITNLISSQLAANRIKISELPAAGSLSRSTLFPAVDSGATVAATLAQLLADGVTTVAVGQDLRNMDTDTLADNSLFTTLGVDTINDGGGGQWIYDANSVATDNVGTVIAPDTGVGRFLRIYDGPLDPKWFEAKGDGLTDDTTAILRAIAVVKAAGGGEIAFSPGTYVVEPGTPAAYAALFALPSNTTIRFYGGATMLSGAATGSTLFAPVWGADQTALPISNLKFKGLRMTQGAAGGGEEKLNAIGLNTASNAAANSIVNVTIDDCTFTDFASAIYITQRRTTGVITRQVNGVKITNCRGTGNLGSFVTADGRDILITGCTAVGSEASPATAYDAVSIHSGINIKVVDNDFSYYSAGQCINVRNSSENKCGSRGIIITGNRIHECSLQSIQVAIQAGEAVYGVTQVTIANNQIWHSDATNTGVGILVTPGSADVGTPFKTFTVTDNMVSGLNSGILMTSNTSFYMTGCVVADNTVTQLITNTGQGLAIRAMQLSSITGNTVQSEYDGASYVPFQIDFCGFMTITGNQLFTSTAYTGSTLFDTIAASVISDNAIYGKYVFSNITTTRIMGNRFQTTGTFNGRGTLSTPWEANNTRITVTDGAGAPGAGTWVAGDRVLIAAPASGAPNAYVCTVAGTPGTWLGYGAVL